MKSFFLLSELKVKEGIKLLIFENFHTFNWGGVHKRRPRSYCYSQLKPRHTLLQSRRILFTYPVEIMFQECLNSPFNLLTSTKFTKLIWLAISEFQLYKLWLMSKIYLHHLFIFYKFNYHIWFLKSQNENVSGNTQNQNQIKKTRHTIITTFSFAEMNNLSRQQHRHFHWQIHL